MYQRKILVITLVLSVLIVGTLSLAAQMNNNIAFATSNNSSSTSSSSSLAHTADYLYGYKIGQTDAKQSGVFDVGDSCDGHVFKNCSAGYSDGFKSVCGDTKTHPKPCK